MGLNRYLPHAKSFGGCDIGYLLLKNRPNLQEVEGAHFCRLILGGGGQILPIVIFQGAVSGLYKWSEDEDGVVYDVTEK